MRPARFIILIISIVLAIAVVDGLLPVMNVAQGNIGKMISVIVLAIIFRATIWYFLNKRKTK